jgi:uncharacterized protein (TIGR02118 family)
LAKVIKTIAFMPRRTDTTREAFRTYYERRHAPLAISFFPFRRYCRNHLVDPASEPGFDCVSEFWVESLEAIGQLMGGEIGETMRADERNFLDQPAIAAVIATELLPGPEQRHAMRMFWRESGATVSLLDPLRGLGVGLDLLAPMDARPIPCDAIMTLAVGVTSPPIDGWRAGPMFAIDCCETDPEMLLG